MGVSLVETALVITLVLVVAVVSLRLLGINMSCALYRVSKTFGGSLASLEALCTTVPTSGEY